MVGLSAVAPRVSKLICMLSSDRDNEVIATVAAITRTLKSAGLDWHDLAKQIEAPAMAYSPRWEPPRSAPAAEPRPAPQPAPPKWKAPWPTYSSLKQSQRLAWLTEIEVRSHCMEPKAKAAFFALNRKMITQPHEVLTRKETNLFNRLVKLFWVMEVRV